MFFLTKFNTAYLMILLILKNFDTFNNYTLFLHKCTIFETIYLCIHFGIYEFDLNFYKNQEMLNSSI